MRKPGKKKKDGRIILQASGILFGMMLVTILVSATVLFSVTLKRVEDKFRSEKEMVMQAVKKSFEYITASDSLLNYWTEHLDEIANPKDLKIEDYNSLLDQMTEEIAGISEKLGLTAPTYIVVGRDLTDEQFQSLSPEEQRIMANYMYLVSIYVLLSLQDEEGRLSVSYFTEDHLFPGQSFVLGSSTDAEGFPRHGELRPYNPGKNPVIERLYREPESNGVLEYAWYSGKLCVVGHVPIVANGEVRAVYTMIEEVDSVLVETMNSVGVFCLVLIIGLLLTGVIVMIFFRRKLFRPIVRIQEDIRDYTTTWDSKALTEKLTEERPPNEVGKLSDDIVVLSDKIDGYVEEIVASAKKRERIEAELDVASKVQMGMLPTEFPTFPEHKGFGLFACMTPAKEVGGDLYDFYLIDPDHLVLVVGDVSDKGVPAALFMARVKALVKSAFQHGHKNPAQVLFEVNNQMCAGNDECMFVTMWIGILELSTGNLLCSNAGHEYPALGKAGKDFCLYKDTHGIPVGLMPESLYQDYTLTLQTGDVLFVYTDGVPEAHNPEGDMFMEEGMLAALNAASDREPKALVESTSRAVAAFAAGRDAFDDITMLCIRV
ncbi:MAG: SpoIIE family protein phosphatase [Lachnospiraceae bacterium]|nr:SpoIIE family protein phosphatase [Lachnospiraceae bacterium]